MTPTGPVWAKGGIEKSVAGEGRARDQTGERKRTIEVVGTVEVHSVGVKGRSDVELVGSVDSNDITLGDLDRRRRPDDRIRQEGRGVN